MSSPVEAAEAVRVPPEFELAPEGGSASWSLGKKNYLRLFEIFRKSEPAVTELLPSAFGELSEEKCIGRRTHQLYVGFLQKV